MHAASIIIKKIPFQFAKENFSESETTQIVYAKNYKR